jgi:glyoxylase-like metal-dependent hydrolase (beta-lactamase superfamily II)
MKHRLSMTLSASFRARQARRILLILLVAAAPAAASDVTTKFETVKVADGIYAFIAPEPKSGIVNSNCVAIIGDDSVIVVDTGQIPSLTRRMVAEIKAQTDKPVRYVINTHWHWDHNLANFVYRDAFPGVSIISTGFTRRSLIEFTPGLLNFFQNSAEKLLDNLRKQRDQAKTETERANLLDDIDDFESGLPEVRQAKLVAPDQTFENAITLYLGKREVRIFHPGLANTAGDAVVYVPDARVLITGDIVVAPTPYATSSYFTDWIAVLKKLSSMDVAAIIPGHGAVQHDRSYISALTALLESLVAQVGAAVRRGLSLEETQKLVDLESFRKRFAGDDRRRNRAFTEYFLKPAIKTAWKQARGEKTTESPF